MAKSAAGEFSVTAAIREGLMAVPEARDSRNRDGTDKLRQWLTAHYPEFRERFEGSTFNATLSGERKKLAAGGSVGGGGRSRASTTVPTASTERLAERSEPTISDLLAARGWVQENGLKLDEAIGLVEGLIGRDLQNFKRSLEGLQQFGGK